MPNEKGQTMIGKNHTNPTMYSVKVTSSWRFYLRVTDIQGIANFLHYAIISRIFIGPNVLS